MPLDSTDLDPDGTGAQMTSKPGTEVLGEHRTLPAEPPREHSFAGRRAPLMPTLALTMTLAIACFAVVAAVLMLLTHPVVIPGLHLEQNQKQESALYAVSFFVILPLALIVVPRLADRVVARTNADALSLLAALLVATLAASILVARVLPGGGGLVGALALVGIWSIGAVALLARASQGRQLRMLAQATYLVPYMWAVAGALVLAALLAFITLSSISFLPLVLGAVAVPALLLVYTRRPDAGLPGVGRRWGLGIDAVFILLLLWAIPNLVFFTAGPVGPYNAGIIQFHHDLWLGPVNEVLAGRPLFVDIGAQYGIAPIYLLAGWFQLAPIGYGTLGFLDGVLFALFFAAGYCLLRIAGASRLLAAGALAFAVIVLVYNLGFSVGSLPQHGPLRFGLPIALIVAAAVEARWPRRARGAWVTQLFVVGLSSVWALEAFAYTVFTFAAIVCFRAWLRSGPGRLAWLARQAGLALAACVAAQLIFTAATLAFTGEVPDYVWYLGFLHAFLFGELAEITYDFSPWSGGLAVGTAYAASAAAFVLLVTRRRDIVEREPTALVALCGTTAYGIALFTYFVDRSPDQVLPYVSLPLVLAGALWLSLLLRQGLVRSRSVRLGGLAFTLSLGMLLLSVSWSSIGSRFDQSPLGLVVPPGESLGRALHGLWHPPPLDPNAPEGERLLDLYMPGERRVTIVTSPDLALEILLRSGRSNQLAFSDPLEDSFVPSRSLPANARAVAELRPGNRLLLQEPGLKAFDVLKTQPSRDVLHNPVGNVALIPEQEWVLQRIGERFDLRVIHREQGFVVAELVNR
jgi:hypothetical protein